MNFLPPQFVVFLCTFIGASTIVVGEPLLTVVPPFLLLAVRFLLASLLLLIFKSNYILPIRGPAIKSGIITGFGFGLGCALLYIALPHLRSGKIAFLISLETVLVPFICYTFLRQKITYSEKVSLLPALVGLWLITGDKDSSFSIWELLAVLSAVSYSIYTISLSKFSTNGGVIQRTWVTFTFIGIFSWITSIIFESYSHIIFSQNIIFGILYLTIIGSLLRFLLQSWGQKYVSASFAALTFTAEPVFTIILSYFFLGERLSLTQYIGAGFILAALFIANFSLLKNLYLINNISRKY